MVADPLADHVVDLRGDVLPPERFPDLVQVPGVDREVSGLPHRLGRGAHQVGALHRGGDDGLPRVPLAHPRGLGRLQLDGQRGGPLALFQQPGRPDDGGLGVGVAFRRGTGRPGRPGR